MAARRGKSQARRNGSNGLPGWAWLVIGVLVTLAVVLAAPRLLKSESADGFFRPRPNPDAQPAATNEDGEAIAPDTATDTAKPEADKPKQTQYDFYTLLPGEGVQMSDAEPERRRLGLQHGIAGLIPIDRHQVAEGATVLEPQ